MNPGSETYTVNLQRDSPTQSWGFRLQGGKDFPTPLSVQMVHPGSLAEQHGIKAGDAVLKINNTPSDELQHEEAKQEIIRSGNQVQLLIQRGAVRIWKPTVTPMSGLKPQQMNLPTDDPANHYIQQTSLAANKQEFHHIGTAHNRTARPFPGFGGGSSISAPPPAPSAPAPSAPAPSVPATAPSAPGYSATYGAPPPPAPAPQVNPTNTNVADFGVNPVGDQHGKALVHAQFNSPINMYSGENLSQTYAAQAAFLNKDMNNLALSDDNKNDTKSVAPTLLAVSDDEKKVPRGVSPTLLAVVREAEVSNAMNKTDEEKTGSNPFKQSRSFKILEQNLSNAEIGEVTGSVPGIRSVSAPVTKPPSERKEAQHMTCGACGMLCTGVFVRIKGVPMHPECFKCVKCGVGLKNKGYFSIEDKLYCEVHARQVAKPPGPDMVAVPIYR